MPVLPVCGRPARKQRARRARRRVSRRIRRDGSHHWPTSSREGGWEAPAACAPGKADSAPAVGVVAGAAPRALRAGSRPEADRGPAAVRGWPPMGPRPAAGCLRGGLPRTRRRHGVSSASVRILSRESRRRDVFFEHGSRPSCMDCQHPVAAGSRNAGFVHPHLRNGGIPGDGCRPQRPQGQTESATQLAGAGGQGRARRLLYPDSHTAGV